MFDFHIHLARLPHPKQLTQQLCYENYDFIAVACEPWEWDEVAQLKKEFSTEVKPFKSAYGIHPMIAWQANDEMFAKLRDFLQDENKLWSAKPVSTRGILGTKMGLKTAFS